MIKLENTEVVGLGPAIRGMRNPMNSWSKSDSFECTAEDCNTCKIFKEYGCPNLDPGFHVGENDYNLMLRLADGGPVHAKYRRMIVVYVDITAPLYWWKEFDTYKVRTVANSCSTMHKIQEKEFTLEDFSHEHLLQVAVDNLEGTVETLNEYRLLYLETKDKKYWWQMIQLLPSSYNQRRTVMLNYEVLAGIYPMRKNHKLDEWIDFCKWIEELPYAKIIIE